jgi:hypothetical protein
VHSYRNAAPQQTSPVVPVAYSPQDQLQIKIVYGYRPGGRGKPQPLTNGGTMHTGDHYKIIFQPLENYYVYIFQSDSSGKIYGLFPLKNFRGVAVDLRNPVQAGKTYFVPAEDKSFALDDQRGLEQIYFLAFRQPDQQLEQLYQKVVEAQNRNTSGQIQAIRTQFLNKVEEKGPAVIVNDPTETGKVTWQEDGQLFSVLRQRLEGMCDGCVNVLRFIHQ